MNGGWGGRGEGRISLCLLFIPSLPLQFPFLQFKAWAKKIHFLLRCTADSEEEEGGLRWGEKIWSTTVLGSEECLSLSLTQLALAWSPIGCWSALNAGDWSSVAAKAARQAHIRP